jgi:hypothetical protein
MRWEAVESPTKARSMTSSTFIMEDDDPGREDDDSPQDDVKDVVG